MAQSVCRTCSAPLDWRDTDEGRRPFNPDGTRHVDTRNGSRGSAASPAKDRQIAKLAVLKAAAAFLSVRPNCKSSDVLTVADRWLEWVES